MKKLAIVIAVALGGCCKQEVHARAFVGHLTEADCAQRRAVPEPPTSILCPGEEVTICWIATGDMLTGVNIAISPDPKGKSGSYAAQGALYLSPAADTSVTVKASDCASETKKVAVLSKPESFEFDAQWGFGCGPIHYTLDPAFVSASAQAIDVTALWAPIVTVGGDGGNPQDAGVDGGDGGSGGAGGPTAVLCKTPPFLNGFHMNDLFNFDVDKPMSLTPFSRPHPATGEWQYAFRAACPPGWTCNQDARLPFAMTLQCPK
jgi:hypothetical protein